MAVLDFLDVWERCPRTIAVYPKTWCRKDARKLDKTRKHITIILFELNDWSYNESLESLLSEESKTQTKHTKTLC